MLSLMSFGRSRPWLTAVIVLVLGCTSCSTAKPDSARQTPREAAAAELTAFAGALAPVDLERPVVEAPKGFSAADVGAFSDQIMAMMMRSFDQRASTMTTSRGFDYVTRDQYPATIDSVRRNVPTSFGDDWKASLVTTLGKKPLKPTRIVRSTWDVTSVVGKLGDGTPARRLRVQLQAHAVVVLGTAKHPVDAIVRRSITLQGYKPRGGPSWWPGLGFDTQYWGIDECKSRQAGHLVLSKRAVQLRDDLLRAKRSLSSRKVIRTAGTSLAEYEKFVALCESEVGRPAGQT